MMAALATSRSGSMASVLGRAPIFASAVSKHFEFIATLDRTSTPEGSIDHT